VHCIDPESLCASLGFFNQFNYPNHVVGFQVRFIMIQFQKLKKDNLFPLGFPIANQNQTTTCVTLLWSTPFNENWF